MPDDPVVLPDIVVEAALSTTNPTSGAGVMTLNSASLGKLDTDFLAGADSWTDITQYVRQFTITRASSRARGPILQFQAGTASLTLNNTDGRFDPDNAANSPYVGNGTPTTQQTLYNSGAGIIAGQAVTTGNSGGASGAPWDVVSVGTGASIVGDNTHLLHGSNAYMLTIGGTSTTALTEWTTSEGTQQTVFFRMYMYFTANPSSGVRPIAFRSGGSLAAAIGVGATGKIQLIDSTNTVKATFTNSIPLNQWFRIEGYITGDAVVGAMSCNMFTLQEGTNVLENQTVTGQNTVGLLTQYWFGNQAAVTNVGPYWYGGVGISRDTLLGPVVSQVLPMVPVRISANFGSSRYYLFKGFADSWQENPVSFDGQISDWVLSATDGFKILAAQNLDTVGSVGAGENSGTRINRILDAASWYTGQGGGARQVDTGDSVVQATTLGDTALNLLQVTADSEAGQLYMDGTGAVVSRHRNALLLDSRSNTSQAYFGDLPAPSYQGPNNSLIPPNDDFEGSIGNWAVNSNCTLADTSAAANLGVNSMSMTSVASGAMSAVSATATANMMRVTPTQIVTVGAYLKAATAARTVQIGAQYFTITGSFISTAIADTDVDNTTAFTVLSGVVSAPGGAYYMRAYIQVNGTAAGSEVHYVDTVFMGIAEMPYASISRMNDDQTLGNDIQATRVGGTLQEAKDATSIAKYIFPRTYTRDDLVLVDDATALQWANWVLYVSKSGEDRFESITVDPMALPTSLWPQVLGRQMGDRVTVIKRASMGDGTYFVIQKDVFISGITHTFDAATSVWSTQFDFQDASKYGSFLTLNNSTLGQLNINALSF